MRSGWGAALFIIVVVGVAAGCGAAARRSAPVVESLRLRGTRQVPAGEISKRILTAPTGWWPLAKVTYFNYFTWQTDLRRIERYYESLGYYQAKVVRSEVVQRGGKVRLEAWIEEGRPTRVQQVEVQGLDPLPVAERQALERSLAAAAGRVFSEALWAELKGSLRSRLHGLGHAEAEVEGRALVDVETQQARLTLLAAPGKRYRFGEIHVVQPAGARVDPRWVHDRAASAIRQGELFSEEALQEAQRRVYGLGVFATVEVRPGEPDRAADTLPVSVAVQEAPFHTLRAGGGVGIDPVRNEARLLAEHTDRDFLGGLRLLRARAQVGWAFLPSLLTVTSRDEEQAPSNGPFFLLGAQLEQPRFFGNAMLRLRTLLESERRQEQAFTSVGGRASIGIVEQPLPDFALLQSYNFEAQRLNGTTIPDTVVSASLSLGCPTNPCLFFLSYLEQSAIWDRRDSPLEPRRGYYLALDMQEAGSLLRGDFTYLRFLPEARAYLTPWSCFPLTLSFRLRLGTLVPASGDAEDSPVITRFYAGGAVSMRGFASRRLAPLLVTPAPGSSRRNPVLVAVPIGGNGLVDGSVEARYALSRRWVLATFFDTGAVTKGDLTTFSGDQLLYAVGLGLRYHTAIGPIRLDLARRLDVGTPPVAVLQDGRRFHYRPGSGCFGIGGTGGEVVRDGLCTLHLSIGEAF